MSLRDFNSSSEAKVEAEADGLSVSVDELIAQQQYLPYLSLKNNRQTSMRAGDVKSAFKGRGMEFEEVRSYTFGDDIRDIDWRVTARKSEPFTKVYNEEKDREIIVFLDLSASMVFGTRNELKSVTACKIAALIGWLAVRNKDRFGILIYDGRNSTYYKPQNNYRNLMAVFKQISQISKKILTESNFGDMADALKKLEIQQKGQGTVFILSDFHHFTAEKFKNIATIAKRNQVYCLNIFDVLEDVAPVSGEYEAQYENKKIVFDSEPDSFKTEYRKYFAQNRDFIKKNCQKFLCKYIEIRTDVPIFKQLHL